MRTVLLATDSDNLAAEVDACLASGECAVLRVSKGSDVLPVVKVKNPDVVLLDMQIGTMGGIAAALALRQEEGAGRLEKTPIGLLLDRPADIFLADEARADGWLIKPVDSLRLRRLFRSLTGTGREGSVFEGRPVDSPVR